MEDLRRFVTAALDHQNAKIREVQRQIESDSALINQTNADLNEFTRKHEAARIDEKVNYVNDKTDVLDQSLADLRTRLDAVMKEIDGTMRRDQGFIERLATVEEGFQGYAQHNFKQIEDDLKTLAKQVRRGHGFTRGTPSSEFCGTYCGGRGGHDGAQHPQPCGPAEVL